jgi:fibronectin-binding autotransporter adhesin
LSNTTSSNKDKWYANNLGAINASLIIDNASQIFVAGGPVSFTGISVTGTGNAEGYGAIRLGNTLGGNITLAGNTTIGLGGGTVTGNIASGAAGVQTLTLGTTAAATTGTFSGTIGGGTGTIVLACASGTSTLTSANTHTGNTLVNGGALVIGHNLALQNSVLDTSGAGSVAFAAGINSPVFGGLSGPKNLTTSSGVTGVTLNTAAGVTATYAGVLGSATPGMSLTKTGPGNAGAPWCQCLHRTHVGQPRHLADLGKPGLFPQV